MRSEKFQIKFSAKARCSLKRIPFERRIRIENAIECLMQSPFYGRKMWKNFQNKRRLKLWPYRIVYEVDEKNRIIFILNIAQRGDMLICPKQPTLK